jgi:hypothetical protein
METFTMRELIQALTQHYKDTSGDSRHVPATLAAVETMQALHRIIITIRGETLAVTTQDPHQ